MGEKEDLRIFHVEIFYFQQKGIAENENKVISHQRAALELAAKGKKKDFPGAKADFDAEKPCEIVLGLKISWRVATSNNQLIFFTDSTQHRAKAWQLRTDWRSGGAGKQWLSSQEFFLSLIKYLTATREKIKKKFSRLR